MSITHCSSLNEVCNDLAMSGSATVTIVTSTRSMNVPAQIATSGGLRHLILYITAVGLGFPDPHRG
jgi:hypothetical protein